MDFNIGRAAIGWKIMNNSMLHRFSVIQESFVPTSLTIFNLCLINPGIIHLY